MSADPGELKLLVLHTVEQQPIGFDMKVAEPVPIAFQSMVPDR